MSLAEYHPYWLDIDDLLTLFPCYSSRDSIYVAIHRKNFPIPTFRVGGRLYADRDVVRKYFLQKKRESEAIQAQEESSS